MTSFACVHVLQWVWKHCKCKDHSCIHPSSSLIFTHFILRSFYILAWGKNIYILLMFKPYVWYSHTNSFSGRTNQVQREEAGWELSSVLVYVCRENAQCLLALMLGHCLGSSAWDLFSFIYLFSHRYTVILSKSQKTKFSPHIIRGTLLLYVYRCEGLDLCVSAPLTFISSGYLKDVTNTFQSLPLFEPWGM